MDTFPISGSGGVGMPFRGMSAMDQKREFVVFAAEGANFRELCRRFGIRPTTGYKWLERYRREGLAGLAEQSRRPQSSPSHTPAAVEAKVLAVRARSNNVWGGRKIKACARGLRGSRRPGGEHDHRDPAGCDRLTVARRPSSGAMAAVQRLDLTTWQMDFKGHFAMHGGPAIRSPRSTASPKSGAGGLRGRAGRRCADLEEAFRRYDLPLAMLMDNGPPWGDPGKAAPPRSSGFSRIAPASPPSGGRGRWRRGS